MIHVTCRLTAKNRDHAAAEPYARQSSTGYIYLYLSLTWFGPMLARPHFLTPVTLRPPPTVRIVFVAEQRRGSDCPLTILRGAGGPPTSTRDRRQSPTTAARSENNKPGSAPPRRQPSVQTHTYTLAELIYRWGEVTSQSLWSRPPFSALNTTMR